MSMIDSIVGRLHVSKSDEEVCLFLISKLMRGAWKKMSATAQADAMHAAVTSHRANRDLYVSVMSGRFGI